MFSAQCPECHQCFSRRDPMSRHQKSKHRETMQAYSQSGEMYSQSSPPPPPPPQGGPLPPPPPPPHLGPPPPPQGAPTPLPPREDRYESRSMRTVFPRVEFVQGITTDLADDDFFDPRINNILDDLYSESGKDKRITDLFTEGFHHWSLSVISINQNIFGNKDATQRRNCHYLVLFNNPVDRQTIMTLARQMYPGNTKKFQKTFARATKNPYGYLFIDLKPFTSENDRLRYDLTWIDTQSGNKTRLINQMPECQNRPNITNQIHAGRCESIKEMSVPELDHSSVGFQGIHIDEEKENTMAGKAQACDDCGLLFDLGHDVQRHVKSGWCSINREPPAKRTRTE
ncbi:hypothetical protein MAR_016315 [Mya arenaria]|uniref:C2H2-type domain-containing protein n=1 Tax=Mya arenaria TaxID=6604 RepID=A0ABY7FNP0_MYAAR|nr:hypothetical protein MAR_016315 [Mya arenaria]